MKTPAVLKALKASLNASRKQFDAAPTAANWSVMLVWSLCWQQASRLNGLWAAEEAYRNRHGHLYTKNPEPAMYGVALDMLEALFPGEPIEQLIRN